ncbi:MAG: Ig-like domain-containing protein [Candidatus Komeilibacteria bacterium]|nr:Ig-like domain-containing protein [Candidatus Komeilibacteria bacterium]
MKKKKRTALGLIFLSAAVLFLISMPVLAAVDLGLGDATDIGLGDRDLKSIIVLIVRIAFGFLGLVAVILILYGGFMWMTAGGNQDRIDKAKRILRNTAIGLVIILAAFGIVEFVFRQLGWATGLQIGSGGDQSYVYSGGVAGGVIRSHYPPRGAMGVPRNVSIVITFKEEIDPDTIIDSDGNLLTENIVIADNEGSAIGGASAATQDNFTYVITPSDYLGNENDDTLYVVSLTSAINKVGGESAFGQLGSYEWQFTVSTELDLGPPRVKSVIPRADSVNPRNIIVQINFSEPVNPLSSAGHTDDEFNRITTTVANGSLVGGNYQSVNQYYSVEFTTSDLCGINSCGQEVYCLPGSETLTSLIKAATLLDPAKPGAVFPYDGIVDMAGNSLDGNADGQTSGPSADDYSWNYSTTDEIDLTPPKLTNVTPGVSSTGVSTRALVKVIFDKLMMLSSLTAESIMIDQNVNYWITSRNKDNTTQSFINHDEFTEFTPHHPLVDNTVRDIYQNCYNPTAGPNDFRIGGTDATYGWSAGTFSGPINATEISGQLRLNAAAIATPAGIVEGSWTSPTLDLGAEVNIGGVFSHGDVPIGSSAALQVRTGVTVADMNVAPWQTVAQDGSVIVSAGQYAQVKVVLKTAQPGVTAQINSVSINLVE